MKNIRVFVPVVLGLMVCSLLLGCGSATSSGGGGGGSSTAKGILYVGCNGEKSIKVFDYMNSTSTDEITAESRVISGDATTINSLGYSSLYIDPVNDELYAGDTGDLGILIFANASTIDGNVAPTRTIEGASTTITYPYGIAVDVARNDVYVADGSNKILVFDRAQNGNGAPKRTISGANTQLNIPTGLYLDTVNDRLFVSSPNNKAILVFDNAHTVSGNIAPTRQITSELWVASPRGIYVYPTYDILVACDRSNNDFYIWYNASTINGSVTPDSFVLGGSASQLDGPVALTVDPVNGVIYQVNDTSTLRPQRVGIWRGKLSGGAFYGDSAPNRIISGEAANQNSGTISLAFDPTR